MNLADMNFYGSALLTTGLLLICLGYGLASRYVYERNHETNMHSCCILSCILTVFIAVSCALVITSHSKDTSYFCELLQNLPSLGEHSTISTID